MAKQKNHDYNTINKHSADIILLEQLDNERLISRSQAKRVVKNLDDFTQIMLDFKDIDAVGQGFVDEIFRVYQNKRPELNIMYRNANDDIEFMIKRGIANATLNNEN